MKISTKTISLFFIALCVEFSFGQSDTPCGGSGAPSLPVAATCSYTTASTVGLTLQTTAANGGSPTCNTISSPDGWYSFTAPLSGGVTITTQAGTITDGAMAVYSGSCSPIGLTQIACNDDANGLMPEIDLSNLTPGDVYFIRIWNYATSTGTMGICITEVAVSDPPTNVNCSVPDPICSGSPISFTAQANGTEASVIDPGNNYDCLFTTPNPSWYYLEIDQSGNLSIDITAGSDVDFALWGPFPSLLVAIANCNSYGIPLDCSYSTSAIEQANVSPVVAGEVYVLLVTNYANTIQTITLSDAPANSATTDCSIVPLPVELAFFSGHREGKTVKLNWATASELSNDYFVVERSVNGWNWQAFDVVTGSGTSSSMIHYESIDKNPSDQISYYRLRQVDFNGSVRFSDIISIDRAHDVFKLFPNPSESVASIRSNHQFESIVVSNAQGNVITSLELNSTYDYDLDVSNWKNGLYYVTVVSSFGSQTERLTVLN